VSVRRARAGPRQAPAGAGGPGRPAAAPRRALSCPASLSAGSCGLSRLSSDRTLMVTGHIVLP
jgi:hypothetical protein